MPQVSTLRFVLDWAKSRNRLITIEGITTSRIPDGRSEGGDKDDIKVYEENKEDDDDDAYDKALDDDDDDDKDDDDDDDHK